MRLVEGGGGFDGGRGLGPGLGGDGGDAGFSWLLISGMIAGRSLAIEILSVVPPGIAILKELGRLSTTR